MLSDIEMRRLNQEGCAPFSSLVPGWNDQIADSTMVFATVEDLTGGELGGAAWGSQNFILVQDKNMGLLC